MTDFERRAEFHQFFERHHQELARFAYMLIGDANAADDLAADAFVTAWRRWDRVHDADRPLAYVRGIVVKLAGSRFRDRVREQRRVHPEGEGRRGMIGGADIAAPGDIGIALRRLSLRKRACVVLQHVFDLSDEETARVLGVSVSTVKTQTSRALKELILMARGPSQ